MCRTLGVQKSSKVPWDVLLREYSVIRCLQDMASRRSIHSPSASHEERTADLEPKTWSRLSRTRLFSPAMNALSHSVVPASEGETCKSPTCEGPGASDKGLCYCAAPEPSCATARNTPPHPSNHWTSQRMVAMCMGMAQDVG